MATMIDHDARIRLNIQMLVDSMDDCGWEFTSHFPEHDPVFTGCLLYCGQKELKREILYAVVPGQEKGFPCDDYSYITTGSMAGKAPHIRCVDAPFGEILNHMLTVFQRYHDFENNLNQVISSGGSLVELCRAGSAFFKNPVYIHDNLFAVLAQSHHLDGMLDFEYNEKTQKVYIPLWLINEFKFDDAYRRTLTLHKASIWGNDQFPKNMRSLFVNLWEGEQYIGRVLINEIGTQLQPGQFRTAEFFAEYVSLWLRNLEMRQHQRSHDFRETLIDLMTIGEADDRDVHSLLAILDWKEQDEFVCLKLQSQNMSNTVRSDSAMNSRLASMLNGCVTFRYQHQMCIVINLSVSGLDEGVLRPQLAPLVRDSCMYAGISNPICGLRELSRGFLQADVAIDYILNEDNSDWMVSFSSCALAYIRENACQKLSPRMVAHPVLVRIRENDEKNGTQYYETLRAYLINERDIPKTAASLIIHRTTLTYRLGKILELTRLNLDDANLRLYLLLSFQLLEQGRAGI